MTSDNPSNLKKLSENFAKEIWINKLYSCSLKRFQWRLVLLCLWGDLITFFHFKQNVDRRIHLPKELVTLIWGKDMSVFSESFFEEIHSILISTVWILLASFFILNILAYLLYLKGKKWGRSYMVFLCWTGALLSLFTAIESFSDWDAFGILHLPMTLGYLYGAWGLKYFMVHPSQD